VPLDALIVINELNGRRFSDSLGRLPVPPPAGNPPPYYDVNGDQYATAQDALIIINYLNSQIAGEGEGESSLVAGGFAATVSPPGEKLDSNSTILSRGTFSPVISGLPTSFLSLRERGTRQIDEPSHFDREARDLIFASLNGSAERERWLPSRLSLNARVAASISSDWEELAPVLTWDGPPGRSPIDNSP